MSNTIILENYPDVLTVKDLQNIFHISRSGAYNLINDPKLKILHIGKRKLVTKSDLLRWMEENTF